MLISVINEAVDHVCELELLLINVNIDEAVLEVSIVVIEGESYVKAVPSCVSDGSVGGIDEFPSSVLIGRKGDIAERITVGRSKGADSGIAYLLIYCVDLYATAKIL